MIPSFVSVALFLAPVAVTPYDLGQHSEKYHGRIVRIEVVLEDFKSDERWHVLVEPKDTFEIIVSGEGKPDARKGDKVAIVGLFRYTEISFAPRVIRGAVMQKIPFDVKPEQLCKRPSPFNGRLIRVEGEVKSIDKWDNGTDVFSLGRMLEVHWKGVAKRDRVRVTGIFNDHFNSFDTPEIDVTKLGSVEKLEPKKP